MEYWLITTTDDKGNMALGGGIMKRQGPQQPITNYIDVESIDEYSSKVQQLGGKVLFRKQQFQEWATSRFVLIRRIMLLAYGRLTKMRSELLFLP
jgi:predicted enzyme related to lactoylglutathione lyase